MKQMDLLLPDDLLEENKAALIACKDSSMLHEKNMFEINLFFFYKIGNGIKDPCEAAYVILQCIYKNNKKFLFP